MQIGFVNFNADEKKRVARMMHLMRESEAIEELGIGRVRDHFSDTLFPGTSTLQHRARYFVLLPSLYYHAAFKGPRFASAGEVARYIRRAEIELTRQLAKWAYDNPRADANGITGISTLREALVDPDKYVKYDPAYIYGSGLARYGLVPPGNIETLILSLSRQRFDNPRYRAGAYGAQENGDVAVPDDDNRPIRTCGEKYDFFTGESMTLTLNPVEASFLRSAITDSCPDTLLTYLLDNATHIGPDIDYFDLRPTIVGVRPAVLDVYDKSVLFSRLMHLIDIRFNCRYYSSFGLDCDVSEREYARLRAEYAPAVADRAAYQALFGYIRAVDPLLTEFCENCYEAIMAGETARVDALVERRERSVKRQRSKIGNPDYRSRKRAEPRPLTFRWPSVRTIVNDIRNPR